MGNSLIFIEVFIVYQTWKQTDLFPSFSSFFIREKEERRFDKDSKKKKKKVRIETVMPLSLFLSRFEGIFQFYRNSSERADGCVESPCTNRRK